MHPPGLKIRQGTCTVSGPVLAETRVDDPGWGGWGGDGDALTPFRSPGASTRAEFLPGDLHGVRACARTCFCLKLHFCVNSLKPKKPHSLVAFMIHASSCMHALELLLCTSYFGAIVDLFVICFFASAFAS